MTLPDFLNDNFLNTLRTVMGAPLSPLWAEPPPIKLIDLPTVERLRGDGIDVDFDEVQILSDQTLSYKGYRVLLYIRDIADYGDRAAMPRFHVAFCRTLQKMLDRNRWNRYVVANRDDGRFLVNRVGPPLTSDVVRLSVCQNCLELLHWAGFRGDMGRSQRQRHVDQFGLKQFFEKYPRDLIAVPPSQTTDTAPLNEYPPDWPEISERHKRQMSYTCSACKIQLLGMYSRYLHVHHKNGQRHDCRAENLDVLCIGCHADQPLHGHMRRSPDFDEFQRLRRIGTL